MAKGENIFKRKDRRWEARYVRGRELSGKIKYGFCYGKTYREAKEKVTRLKTDLADGKYAIVYGQSSCGLSFHSRYKVDPAASPFPLPISKLLRSCDL